VIRRSARRGASLGCALAAVGALAAAGLLSSDVVAAPPCEPPRGFEAQGRVESPDVVVLYRAVPSPIQVGRHFTVEAVVCPAPPPGAASGLSIDAYMPEHRHGMNYRPRVARAGDGVYVAQGLLFHMPGQWQLRFDVDRGGKTQRLSADIELE
jgi:hypothetical protein